MSTTSATWRAANGPELGRALARVRQQAGLTQEAMATRLGIDRTYLARVETGLATGQLLRIFAILRETGYELAIVERADNG